MTDSKDNTNKGKRPRLLAYRGVSCNNFLWIRGRIVADNQLPEPSEQDSLWGNIRNSFKRVTQNGYANRKGTLMLHKQEFEFTTDRFGFIDFYTDQLVPQQITPFRSDVHWTFSELNHQITSPKLVYDIDLKSPYGLISDIDDTVVHTFVEYKSQAVLRTMMGNAYTKDAIAGAATMLNKLGLSEPNKDFHLPIIYVSRSPYQIYDVLQDFFHLNNFPDGPIWLKYAWFNSLSYKQNDIVSEPKFNNMCRFLEMTAPLPFIVFGDSAELDAIIYLNLAKKYPNRIRKIYIRRVTKGRKFESLKQEVEKYSVSDLVLFFKYYHELDSDVSGLMSGFG